MSSVNRPLCIEYENAYVCVYVFACLCVYVCVCERERDRQTGAGTGWVGWEDEGVTCMSVYLVIRHIRFLFPVSIVVGNFRERNTAFRSNGNRVKGFHRCSETFI